MYRLLLIDDRPIYIKGLSEIAKEVIKPACIIDVASSLQIATNLLATNPPYQMLICGHPIHIKDAKLKFLAILKNNPALCVMMFTDFADITSLKPYRSLYQNLYLMGIRGILRQQASVEEIQTAITQVYKGGIYVNMDILVSFLMSPASEKRYPKILTKQEKVVAELLIDGKTNKQMCMILKLQPSTISTFKNRVFKKLKVRNVVELSKIEWLAG